MVFILSSLLGIFTMSIIAIVGSATLGIVNLVGKAFNRKPFVDGYVISSILYSALFILVVELILVFIIF